MADALNILLKTSDNFSDNFVALISSTCFIISSTLCSHLLSHPAVCRLHSLDIFSVGST